MVVIRPIREEDAPAFRELLDGVARERRWIGQLEAPPVERVQAFVTANVVSDLPHFVAEEDGRIVGWCDILPGEASAGTTHVGRFGMGVLMGLRGKGIGRRLAVMAIEGARRLGLEKVELSVYSSNEPAIALYRSLGFTDEGRKKRGRLVDGIYDDVVLMALDFSVSQDRSDSPAV
jgi:ribosomal protein S18 acetylase RimI-like enzyme